MKLMVVVNSNRPEVAKFCSPAFGPKAELAPGVKGWSVQCHGAVGAKVMFVHANDVREWAHDGVAPTTSLAALECFGAVWKMPFTTDTVGPTVTGKGKERCADWRRVEAFIKTFCLSETKTTLPPASFDAVWEWLHPNASDLRDAVSVLCQGALVGLELMVLEPTSQSSDVGKALARMGWADLDEQVRSRLRDGLTATIAKGEPAPWSKDLWRRVLGQGPLGGAKVSTDAAVSDLLTWAADDVTDGAPAPPDLFANAYLALTDDASRDER